MAEDQKTRLKGCNNPNWKNGITEKKDKICARCRSKFTTTNVRDGNYCSVECWNKTQKENKKAKKAKIEPVRKKYYCQSCIKNEVKRKTKQCWECINNIRAACKKQIVCITCGNTVTLKKQASGKYCGRSCARKDRTGPRNSNYKGGITPQNKKIRASEEYKQWRLSVFQRDEYTCQSCGQVGGKLNADHIKQFAFHPELRLDVSNGRTLCVECHKKTDTFMKGRKRVA